MERAGCHFEIEDRHQPFNLTPAAKMDMVSKIAACLCPFSSFQPGGIAKTGDQGLRLAHIAGVYVKR